MGNTLSVVDTATTDVDGDSVTLSYQWQADGVDISGATANTYTVQSDDAGAAITLSMSAGDGYGGTAGAMTGAVSIEADSGRADSSSGGGGALGWIGLLPGLLLLSRRRRSGRRQGSDFSPVLPE